MSDASPWLNLYEEPAEWLTDDEQARLGPLACFGSLRSDALDDTAAPGCDDALRVYASFGTVIWRYWAAEATTAFLVIAEACRDRAGTKLVIGLGGGVIASESREALLAFGARVANYADQWKELGDADVFITHHGLGSVHEAVARHRTDALAAVLLGPASSGAPGSGAGSRPAVDRGRGRDRRPTTDHVSAGLDALFAQRTELHERLLVAQEWERRTIASWPAVARQVLAVGL